MRVSRSKRKTSNEKAVEAWALEHEVLSDSLDKYVDLIKGDYQMLVRLCGRPHFKVHNASNFTQWAWRSVAIEYLEDPDKFLTKLLYLFFYKRDTMRYSDLRKPLDVDKMNKDIAEVERDILMIIHLYNQNAFLDPDDSGSSFLHTVLAFATLDGIGCVIPVSLEDTVAYMRHEILDMFIVLKLYKQWWKGKINDVGNQRINDLLDDVLNSSRRLAIEDGIEADT